MDSKSYQEKLRQENKKLFEVSSSLAVAFAFLCGGVKYLNSQSKASQMPNKGLETKVVQTVEVNNVNEVNEPNEVRVNEFNNARVNDIMNYSEENINWLAKGMYGEARGEVASGNIDYAKGYAKSVITRANLRGKTIKDILLQTRPKKTEEGKTITVYQYTCFDPKNEENKKNYKEVNNPSDLKTFELCRQTAKELLLENSFPDVTNYYVGKSADSKKYKTKKEISEDGIPSWAFEMKGKYFVKDEEGYLVPRKPVLVTSVRQTEKNPDIKAYFYYFKNF